MKAMVDAMARISDTSNKIGNIISEIEDIASQTNLLSLNASIEQPEQVRQAVDSLWLLTRSVSWQSRVPSLL